MKSVNAVNKAHKAHKVFKVSVALKVNRECKAIEDLKVSAE